MKFGMFFLAEFVEIVIVAGLVTTLFFGGWQFPYLQADGFHWPFEAGVWHLPHVLVVLIQIGTFCLKVALWCWILRYVGPSHAFATSGHAPDGRSCCHLPWPTCWSQP
jgi:NADH-quinone oxidoreductase subunit H